ncbi:hypothetical protein TNCT_219071 [Trichonephila clavata]|uniref:Uncharacterized protein n=1 Tax=Trichonephila clavata TaxID=2740835 RepID=A0A8X6GHZ8_TRICU|nr:hypothetical protein TNCT_219071 [Trichonephila clavata]
MAGDSHWFTPTLEAPETLSGHEISQRSAICLPLQEKVVSESFIQYLFCKDMELKDVLLIEGTCGMPRRYRILHAFEDLLLKLSAYMPIFTHTENFVKDGRMSQIRAR